MWSLVKENLSFYTDVKHLTKIFNQRVTLSLYFLIKLEMLSDLLLVSQKIFLSTDTEKLKEWLKKNLDLSLRSDFICCTFS